jgi:hypothetical protein
MTLATLVFGFLACIEPDPADAPPLGAGANPAVAGEPGAPRPPGEPGAPATGGAPPDAVPGTTALDPAIGGAPAKGVIATPGALAALAAGGKTVALTLQLTGADSAVVDFIVEADVGPPIIVAQERVKGATTVLALPAAYAKGLWVSAFYDKDGDGPDSEDPAAVSEAAVVIDGTPKTVTLVMKAGGFPPKIGLLSLRPIPQGAAVTGMSPAGPEAPSGPLAPATAPAAAPAAPAPVKGTPPATTGKTPATPPLTAPAAKGTPPATTGK